MQRKRSEKSGTARMIELGNHPLQIWLGPTLWQQLDRLAKRENTSKATYVKEALRIRLADDAARTH